MDRVKPIWYLSPMRAAKVQASLHIRAVSPEPSLLAHTSSESRGTFRQKARSLAPLNGWSCAVEICHDGMLEDTNSHDGAHMLLKEKEGNSDRKSVIAIGDPINILLLSFENLYGTPPSITCSGWVKPELGVTALPLPSKLTGTI